MNEAIEALRAAGKGRSFNEGQATEDIARAMQTYRDDMRAREIRELDMRRRLERAADTARAYQDALADVLDNALVSYESGTVVRMIRIPGAPHPGRFPVSLDPIRGAIRSAEHTATYIQHRLVDLFKPAPLRSRGRQRETEFRAVILALGTVYQNATGKKAAAGNNRKGDKDSPFIRFVRAVIQDYDLPILLSGIGNRVSAALQA